MKLLTRGIIYQGKWGDPSSLGLFKIKTGCLSKTDDLVQPQVLEHDAGITG